jgi:hypothetical protein
VAAPNDPTRLPLRWEFIPAQRPGDGTIRWRWRGYTQAGKLAVQSEGDFETLTECMSDARSNGYGAG